MHLVTRQKSRLPDVFELDEAGRTGLFYAAAKGDLEEVRRIAFSLTGTGMCCQRLSLIGIKDSSGATASDLAGQNGHKEIADFLLGEQMRMEFFE